MKHKETNYVKVATPSAYIRYKGVWDMQDLYQSMVDYFRERKYYFHESIYKHKHPSPFGVERQYVWYAERKETEYVLFHIDVYIHTYDASDIDVVDKSGTKKTLTKGRMWMEFRAHMEYDWENRWRKTPFQIKLMNFYNKHVVKKKMETWWWDRLWYREVNQLHGHVKKRLKMESEGYEHLYWTGVHQ